MLQEEESVELSMEEEQREESDGSVVEEDQIEKEGADKNIEETPKQRTSPPVWLLCTQLCVLIVLVISAVACVLVLYVVVPQVRVLSLPRLSSLPLFQY